MDLESMSRDEIKDYLLALAEKHVESRKDYKPYGKDASMGMEAWWGEESGVPLTVVTLQADGLTIDDFKAFHHPDVYAANASALDAAVTCRRMDDNIGDDVYIIYQHIKTPRMVANRCCFASVYSIDLPDGGFIHMTTTSGNRGIAQANEALVGKDVLSTTHITFNKFVPLEGGGCYVTSVLCVDAAGDLPGFIKNQIAAANSKSSQNLVQFVRKQKQKK